MNNQIDRPEGKLRSGSTRGERLLAIGQKLGIAIPAGLLLFCGVNASAMTRDAAKISFSPDAARENEVARHLTEITNNRGGVLLADEDNPLHGNTHVDTHSPNVHNDYSDSGKHTNTHGDVHTNTHGNANRY
ncbi:hypothetical protein NY406_06540 [Chlorobaculum sp. MV4-Y]|jgi:hypothetical protein|uniref:hypothetical protein n=1 Tax=Chlorobaculum sp. MV4-Y TaxID=2976335 RepID=UPI0021AEA49F|nr:hypothetical protein [Chlorobaculum sp. MV4-Y]UWX56907.1 hypothetical protein NY406_06540 [Chlorobaculum sp. MV4-Y]